MCSRAASKAARATDRTGADIDPPAVQASHGDLETVAFLADAVGDGDAAILEIHRRSWLRMPAELLFLLAKG